MWPLPVSDLLFVGKSSVRHLHDLGIFTIGDLAKSDVELLKKHFKKHGEDMWKSANGIDETNLRDKEDANKGYGNSITLPKDVTDREQAHMILLSLSETVGARLRADHAYISVVSVNIVDADFRHSSKQISLPSTTDITEEIYQHACRLFDELWDFSPIRLLGVQTSKATSENYVQYDLFQSEQNEKFSKLNAAIDQIRDRYGKDAVKRARFLSEENK